MAELDHRAFYVLYGGGAAPGSGALLVMIALTVLGSGWTMFALVPMIAMRRTRALALSLLGSLLLTAAAVALAKAMIQRARPCVALAGVHALFQAPSDYSFPSGHAAGSFAFAAFVATIAFASRQRARGRGMRPCYVHGRPVRIATSLASAGVAFALAAGIAVSRVYLGCHFPGDVLGGALLGSLIGAAGARWHLARGAYVAEGSVAAEPSRDGPRTSGTRRNAGDRAKR